MKKRLLALQLISMVTTVTAMHRKITKPTFHIVASNSSSLLTEKDLNNALQARVLTSLLTRLVAHPRNCPSVYFMSTHAKEEKQLVVKVVPTSLLLSYQVRNINPHQQNNESIWQWIPENKTDLGFTSKTFQEISRITARISLPEKDKKLFEDIIHVRQSGTIVYENGILTVEKK